MNTLSKKEYVILKHLLNEVDDITLDTVNTDLDLYTADVDVENIERLTEEIELIKKYPTVVSDLDSNNNCTIKVLCLFDYTLSEGIYDLLDGTSIENETDRLSELFIKPDKSEAIETKWFDGSYDEYYFHVK